MRALKDLTIKEFKREDADVLQEQHGEVDAPIKELLPVWKEAYATMGPGYSVFDGDKLLWCVGAVQYWPGTAEAWMLVPADINGYAREMYYYTKMIADQAMEQWKWQRLQARVKADFVVGQRFLEKMGFEREVLLRKMGPGYEDYFLYARVV